MQKKEVFSAESKMHKCQSKWKKFQWTYCWEYTQTIFKWQTKYFGQADNFINLSAMSRLCFTVSFYKLRCPSINFALLAVQKLLALQCILYALMECFPIQSVIDYLDIMTCAHNYFEERDTYIFT